MPPFTAPPPSRQAGGVLTPLESLFCASSSSSRAFLLSLLLLVHLQAAVGGVPALDFPQLAAERVEKEQREVDRHAATSETQRGSATLAEAEQRGVRAFNPSVYTPHLIEVGSEGPIRLMFGSCNLQPTGGEWQVEEEDRLMWSFMAKRQPKVFAWLGDNVYAHNYRYFALANSVRWNWRNLSWTELKRRRAEASEAFRRHSTIEEIREAFRNQTSYRFYQDFVRTGVEIVGTYDDHDLGEDNPSKVHPLKYEARDVVLDFFNVPADSPRRSIYWEGAYSAHKIQVDADLSFRIIILDTRFSRDPWTVLPHGDILGTQQWKWLEEELRKSAKEGDAVTFITSSIQVLPSPFIATEAWSIFPHARRRLLNLVMNSGVQMPVFLSGDVHFSEMNRVVCRPLHRIAAREEEAEPVAAAAAAAGGERQRAEARAGERSAQCPALSPLQRISLVLFHLSPRSDAHWARLPAPAAGWKAAPLEAAFRARCGEPSAELESSWVSLASAAGARRASEWSEYALQTAWQAPGLFERVFPVASFLSTYVLTSLFAPPLGASFALLASPHPVEELLHLLDEGRVLARERAVRKLRPALDRADAEADGVELREFTSSGLTHGIEETFLMASSAAKFADWVLRTLLPRTTTLRDDFLNERLVYTHRNVGDIQLVRSPLYLFKEEGKPRGGAEAPEKRQRGEAHAAEAPDATEASLRGYVAAEDRNVYASLLARLSSSCMATSASAAAGGRGAAGEQEVANIDGDWARSLAEIRAFFAGKPERFHLLLALYARLLHIHARAPAAGEVARGGKSPAGAHVKGQRTTLNIPPRKSRGACAERDGSAAATTREKEEDDGVRASVWCWLDEEEPASAEKQQQGSLGEKKATDGHPSESSQAPEGNLVEYSNRPGFPYPLLQNEAFFRVLFTVEALLHASVQRLAEAALSPAHASSLSAAWTEELSVFCRVARSPSREAVGGILRFLHGRQTSAFAENPRSPLLREKLTLLHTRAAAMRTRTDRLCEALAGVFTLDRAARESPRICGATGESRGEAKDGDKELLRALSTFAAREAQASRKSHGAGEREANAFSIDLVPCGDVQEVLAARVWIAIHIFALPFGDLVLESFLSPFAFQRARERLLQELAEEDGQPAAAESRVRWLCEAPEGPDRTPAYVAVALLLLLFSLAFCLGCCVCVCGRGCSRPPTEAARRAQRSRVDRSAKPSLADAGVAEAVRRRQIA
ncbi:hypothetical protein BESB_030390 [Besnoitia besnoiti]|uniref:PhoD-like phosphatase metallophosphatase domain-containing protein n=1 Tax=Besnoitia besnoiti TaxID=94643 RepID=A0A2A9LZH5_BESBE|nr:hypothetical protein BESB_030390 [Besnoitia besnoiti]PFH31165.1 hypothetical protein BESB_030390 [Besnoitia besnoiti]